MRDPARWKRYRGGMSGELWVKREGETSWNQLTTLSANLASPMILGSRIYFVSDSEGFGGLYSCTFSGEELRLETRRGEYYVRFPSTDGTRIVYQAGGDIYLFDPLRRASSKVEIDVQSTRNDTKRRFVDASEFIEEYDLNSSGEKMLLISRGKPFVFSPSSGPVLQLGEGEGKRYGKGQFLHDDHTVVVVSEEFDGHYFELYDSETGEQLKRLDLNIGRPLYVTANPKEGKLAVNNHRGELFVIDLEEERAALVQRAPFAWYGGWDWSPCGRWLAYSFCRTTNLATIALYDTVTKVTSPVTGEQSFDVSPSFDPEGGYLYFLSSRILEPVYDHANFEPRLSLGLRPFALILRKHLPSPLHCSKLDERLNEIDVEGMERRIVAIPVPGKRYRRVEGISGRRILLLSELPDKGRWWEDNSAPTASLDLYHLADQRVECTKEGIHDFSLSRSHSEAIYRIGNRLERAKAGEGITKAVDLQRVKLSINPREEWRQIFREAWQKQCDYFWCEKMSGVEWTKMYERYAPLLERIGTRSELSDLLRELQGELGTSHAVEWGGDYPRPQAYPQGSLGADLLYDHSTDSYTISRIIRGDSWDESARSPLEAPGLEIEEGDRIVAVEHKRVSRGAPPSMFLLNKAATDVVIRVASKRSGQERDVIVRPLGYERALRYRDWVETNRSRVRELSQGRVGYLHIPDMFPWGYKEFQRHYMNEVSHEGLIVDVRYNLGGHLGYLFLDRLARREIGHGRGRWTGRLSYPELSPGPLVALANQYTYSDGELFTHGFRVLNLGPVIGQRTGGGAIAVCRHEPLVDGGLVTQPERAFFFNDVGFGLENYGVEPDIEVRISPDEAERGEDPQLKRAIEEVLGRCDAIAR